GRPVEVEVAVLEDVVHAPRDDVRRNPATVSVTSLVAERVARFRLLRARGCGVLVRAVAAVPGGVGEPGQAGERDRGHVDRLGHARARLEVTDLELRADVDLVGRPRDDVLRLRARVLGLVVEGR